MYVYIYVFVAYVFHVCMYDLQIFYAKNNDMGGSKRKLFYFNFILFCKSICTSIGQLYFYFRSSSLLGYYLLVF